MRQTPVIAFLLTLLLCNACQRFSGSPLVIKTDTLPPPSLTASFTPIPSTATPTMTLAPSATPTIYTSTPSLTPTPVRTTLLFTGVIVPARCVQSAIDAGGDPESLYDEVRTYIQKADLAVGTLNATISDYPHHTGCVPTYILVGSPNNADALAHAGFDAMSVATNHIKDCGMNNCGDRTFFDTLDNLHRVGIVPVGAGKDQAEAMQPIVVTINGVRFGIVSQGQIQQGGVYAEDNKPGIARLTSENIQAAIAATRRVADVVIFMPHWGPEDVAWPNWIQRDLAHQIVTAGADLVVGNHTHVVQAVQQINGVQVFYGLGNFVFDQWEQDHEQGVILEVYFDGAHYAGYQFIPTHVEKNGHVHIADSAEAAQILSNIDAASAGLK